MPVSVGAKGAAKKPAEGRASVGGVRGFPYLGLPKKMGCLRLTYQDETERPNFLSVWKKSDGLEKSTNYQSWGGVLREQKYDPDSEYRYGYQGKYAEKDDETKWNHFQLREYDNFTGRWTTRDPKKQFYSGYVGMGNNPINGVDPDGGKVLDDFQVGKDGSVTLLRETNDPFHAFYNEKGRLLFTTSLAKNEEFKIWEPGHFGNSIEFNEALNAVIDVQSALRNSDLFNKMFDRAQAVGWDPTVIGEMRIASDYNQIGRAIGIGIDLLPISKVATGYKTPDSPTILGKVYELFTGGRHLGADCKKALNETKSYWSDVWWKTKSGFNSFNNIGINP